MSIDGGEGGAAGGAGAGGGDVDVIAAAFGGGVADPGAAGGEGGGDPAGAAGGAAGAGEAPAWLTGLSADAPDGDTPSNRDFIAGKGFKDLDSVVKSYREVERMARAGGKIEPLKDGATPEQVEAFHKAIGRPEKPEGYEIKLPDGVEGALDETLLGSFREAAFKAGLPAPMASQLGDWFIQQQMDADAAVVAQRDREFAATIAEWGPQAAMNRALCNRAAQKLDISAEDVADIQKGYGAAKTLKLLQKLGAGLAEDAIIEGGGREKFGVTGAQAQAQLDQLQGDKDFMAKVYAGDTAAVGRRERLMQQVAAEMDHKARAG